MDISHKLESILLFKGQPVSYKELAKLLVVEEKEIKDQVKNLSHAYQEKGIQIAFNDFECEMVTAADSHELLSQLQKQDTETELSNAALETLSIILYMGPIARNMIDYIRGVNSQFTVRNLLVRGLIEKDPNSKSTKYVVSLDTIKFLGLNKLSDLPNYKEVKHSIAEFVKENSNEAHE